MKLKISIALLLALAPSMSFAKPRNASDHMRPQLFRDRTPKAHVPQGHVHEVRTASPK